MSKKQKAWKTSQYLSQFDYYIRIAAQAEQPLLIVCKLHIYEPGNRLVPATPFCAEYNYYKKSLHTFDNDAENRTRKAHNSLLQKHEFLWYPYDNNDDLSYNTKII